MKAGVFTAYGDVEKLEMGRDVAGEVIEVGDLAP